MTSASAPDPDHASCRWLIPVSWLSGTANLELDALTRMAVQPANVMGVTSLRGRVYTVAHGPSLLKEHWQARGSARAGMPATPDPVKSMFDWAAASVRPESGMLVISDSISEGIALWWPDIIGLVSSNAFQHPIQVTDDGRVLSQTVMVADDGALSRTPTPIGRSNGRQVNETAPDARQSPGNNQERGQQDSAHAAGLSDTPQTPVSYQPWQACGEDVYSFLLNWCAGQSEATGSLDMASAMEAVAP